MATAHQVGERLTPCRGAHGVTSSAWSRPTVACAGRAPHAVALRTEPSRRRLSATAYMPHGRGPPHKSLHTRHHTLCDTRCAGGTPSRAWATRSRTTRRSWATRPSRSGSWTRTCMTSWCVRAARTFAQPEQGTQAAARIDGGCVQYLCSTRAGRVKKIRMGTCASVRQCVSQ